MGLVVAIIVAGIVIPAAAASADTTVPPPVGMMGAAEAPSTSDGNPAAPALQAVGMTFLLGGGITVARSWVSTKEPV